MDFRSSIGLPLMLLGCVPTLPVDDTGTDTSSSAESSTDTGGTGQGQTSGPTTGQTSDTGTNTDDPTSSDTQGQPCPPIDIGPCHECTCTDEGWVCEPVCPTSCEGLECGTSCLRCAEDDPECASPELEGVCTAEGQCVGTPPPKLGFCEGALQPGFEGELEVVWGCSDMVVFAHDAADERGLVLHVDQGLFAEAVASGMPVHAELPATDPSVFLEARAGFYVTALECSDFIENEPDINENWLPTAGTVIIDLVPVDANLANATVQLVGVELHRQQPGPAPIVVDVTWTDVSVGPVPG